MRASSTPQCSYGASRATAGRSQISSMRSPSADSASPSNDLREASSKTRTSSTTLSVARSTVTPGLNVPLARTNEMSDGRMSGLVARRSRGAITKASRGAQGARSRRPPRYPLCVETAEVLRRRAIVLVGADVEDLWHRRLYQRTLITTLSESSEYVRCWLLTSVSSNESECALAHRGRQRREAEQSSVVVRVTPRVRSGGARIQQSSQHGLVIARLLLLRREVLRPRAPKKIVGDRTSGRSPRSRAHPELLHQRPAARA